MFNYPVEFRATLEAIELAKKACEEMARQWSEFRNLAKEPVFMRVCDTKAEIYKAKVEAIESVQKMLDVVLQQVRIVTPEQLEKIDRNARAFGWEIGQGQPFIETLETSEENPFADDNWREKFNKKDDELNDN